MCRPEFKKSQVLNSSFLNHCCSCKEFQICKDGWFMMRSVQKRGYPEA